MKGGLKPVWIYFYDYGARGFGHIGIIIPQSGGTLASYSQGAINPRDYLIRLIIFAQKAKVTKKVFPPYTTISFIAKDARIAKLHTRHHEKIEACISDYIKRDNPYNSFKNNCANFISLALNAADDLSVPYYAFPKRLFAKLQILAHQQQSQKNRL